THTARDRAGTRAAADAGARTSPPRSSMPTSSHTSCPRRFPGGAGGPPGSPGNRPHAGGNGGGARCRHRPSRPRGDPMRHRHLLALTLLATVTAACATAGASDAPTGDDDRTADEVAAPAGTGIDGLCDAA